MVLVDGATASSAEIVRRRGSDWDRAVLSANVTYGRAGLVQRFAKCPTMGASSGDHAVINPQWAVQAYDYLNPDGPAGTVPDTA